MKIPDELIKVSRSSILQKRFGVTEEEIKKQFTGEELTEALALLPTPEEVQFMEYYQSKIPQLARYQRKISVCLDAEIKELYEDVVSYEYSGNTYRIEAPKNAFRICSALEKGELNAVLEVCRQKCIKINGKIIPDISKDGVMLVDEMQLLQRIISKFFFQIFLG